MARRSAINAVAEAVVTALDVAAVRALCPGGVYRNRPQAQTPPYLSVGPCHEGPLDAFGTSYGAVVTVPVSVVLSGADANGESRAITILDKVTELLDEPVAYPTLSGWTLTMVEWVETRIIQTDELLIGEGPAPYLGTATWRFHVRQA